MPSHIKIIHAHEFIKATAGGELDFEETKKILIEIATATGAAPLDDYEIILDTRKAYSRMCVTELYDLVTELGKFRKTYSHKMAVLCPLNRFGFADFFALCANNRGFQVHAFTSYSDAIEWLIMETDNMPVNEIENNE